MNYHESLVTYGLTKPTGSANRSIQMGMHGNKILDRLYPEVMENSKKEKKGGFFIKNDSK